MINPEYLKRREHTRKLAQLNELLEDLSNSYMANKAQHKPNAVELAREAYNTLCKDPDMAKLATDLNLATLSTRVAEFLRAARSVEPANSNQTATNIFATMQDEWVVLDSLYAQQYNTIPWNPIGIDLASNPELSSIYKGREISCGIRDGK